MSKKILALVFMFALMLGGVFATSDIASAQTATFPVGCSSALGYSVTTGLACNGTATATIGFLPGCTTALGFSTVNGVPCSGGPVAINFLAGCSSIFGYSVITGAPCNGTTFAAIDPGVVVVPGLPTTGGSGSATSSMLFLLATGALATAGLTRLARRSISL